MGKKRNRKKVAKNHMWDMTSEQGRKQFQEHMDESERMGKDIIMTSYDARFFHGIAAPDGVAFVALTAQDIGAPQVLDHPRLGIVAYVVPYKFMRERLQAPSQVSTPTLH
jgi:hypothetical protein